MRGRRPSGPEYVEHLDGPAVVKQRLKVILETLAGVRRVSEACTLLGISEQRFHQLREQALTGALQALQPGTPGPKPHTLSPAEEQVHTLQQQVANLQVELTAALAREEIALTIPRVVQEPTQPEKKTPPRSPRKRSRRGRKKNT
jgi:hypothetical protein